MERFEKLGYQIMHRSGGGMMDEQPVRRDARRPRQAPAGRRRCSARRSSSPTTRSALNREGTEHVADRLIAAGELYGDDVDRPARRRAGCASPRSTSWTRRHGPRSDPAALARRPARRATPRRSASAPASARRAAAPSGRGAARRAPTARVGRTRPPRPPAERRSPYRSRFGFVLGRADRRRRRRAGGRRRRLRRHRRRQRRRREDWSAWKPDTDDGRRRRARDRRPRRRASTGSTTATSSSASQGGPLEVVDVPLEVALRTAPQGGDIELHRRQRACMYTLNGLGPKRLDPRRQAVARRATCCCAARRSSSRSTRSATSRTSTWWSRCCRPAAGQDQEQGRPTTTSTDGPADRRRSSTGPATSSRSSQIPLRATIPAETPRPETIPAAEARPHRRADAAATCSSPPSSRAQNQKAFLVLDRLPRLVAAARSRGTRAPARAGTSGTPARSSSAGRARTPSRAPVRTSCWCAQASQRPAGGLSIRRWPSRASSS